MLHVRAEIIYTFFISLSIAPLAQSLAISDPTRVNNPFSRAIESEEFLKVSNRFTGIAKARVTNVFGLCARPELLANPDFRQFLEATDNLEFDAVSTILSNFREAEKVDEEYYATLSNRLAFLRVTRTALRKSFCVQRSMYDDFKRIAHELPLTPELVFKLLKNGDAMLDAAANFHLRLRLSETTTAQMSEIEAFAAERKDSMVIARLEEMKIWWLMLRSDSPPINVKVEE